jgi:iron complex outermembrane receptor protein
MAASLLAAISAPVAAQDRPREPGQSQEPIPLPELTVPGLLDPYNPSTSTTGTKIEAPLRDIPQSIQVVPRKVIDDQHALTLSDVLRNVSGFSPSVNSQSQRFGDRSVIFRGFTVNNYYTNGYKDPFNGSSFTTALANVDRVEVLKGPASVLYGLGDPGATINIITKQPLPEWYGAASVTAGSFGYISPSLDVSGPLTRDKAIRFRLNAAYQEDGSFVDFVESNRYLIAPVLSFSLGADTRLTLEGEYQAVGESTGRACRPRARSARTPTARFRSRGISATPSSSGTTFPSVPWRSSATGSIIASTSTPRCGTASASPIRRATSGTSSRSGCRPICGRSTATSSWPRAGGPTTTR